MAKRKAGDTAPEKIDFDPAAREEYLTGFHKRKLARIKHAQEENAKREKEEKLRFRREVRVYIPFEGGKAKGVDRRN
jgi:ribosomal RNA-processing protein 17